MRRNDRGGQGTGITRPEAEDAGADEDKQQPRETGEAYEDNWYRSLKAFAAARQAFGNEDEPAEEDASEDEATDAAGETEVESAPANPSVFDEPAPVETPRPAPAPEEHFIKGSAPQIKHVDPSLEGSAGDRAVIWRNLEESPRDAVGGVLERLTNQGKNADLVKLALEHGSSHLSSERVLSMQISGHVGGDSCVDLAIGSIADTDPAVRTAAVRALADLHPGAAAEPLGKRMEDPEPSVRIEVVKALGVIDHPSILGSLFAFLSDPDPGVRAVALEVLTEWRSPAVAKRLAEVLASPELRNMASEVLVEMGPASEKLLLEVLMQQQPGTQATVGRLLGRISGIDGCIERLTSPDPQERLRGVEALGAMGGPRAVESLVGTLSDPDSAIRVRSIQLLGRLGDQRAGSAIEHSARTDPVQDVVTAAEEALQRLATSEASAG
ncbi:MAG: HEAT repeat domain-containing protein [Actinomycetota bacterium]